MRLAVQRSLCALMAATFVVPPNILFAQDAGGGEGLGAPTPATICDLTGLDRLDVNPLAGELLYSRTDLVIGESEQALAIKRTYRPWQGDKLNMGLHWVSVLDLHLDVHPKGTRASFVDEDGYRYFFREDEKGRLVSTAGRLATVERRADGFVLTGIGDERTYRFDRKGWLRSRLGPASLRVDFSYDQQDRLQKITGPWGEIAVKRDAQGRLSQLEAPGERVVRYERGETGQVTRVSSGELYESYSYTSEGRLQTIADGRAIIHHDAVGRVVGLAGPALRRTTYQYMESSAGKETLITRAGQTQTVRVSRDGRTIEEINGAGERSLTHLDDRDRLARFVAPDGREWTQTYDARGRIVERTGPIGTTRFEYGSKFTSRPTRIDLSDGRTVRFAYDMRGNLSGVTAPGGAKTTYVYDALGRLHKTTDARGALTTFTRDKHGYVIQVEETGKGVTRLLRDEAGRILKVKQPDGRVASVVRDGQGRAMRVTDALGSVYEVSYDARGKVTRYLNELGREYRYDWNERGELQSVRDQSGGLLGLEYGPAGQVRSITDANGNKTTYTQVDAHTMVVEDPAQGRRQITRDAAGRVVEEVRGSQKLSYAYDERGLLSTRTTPSGIETFAYDAAGRVVGLQGPQGGFKLAYDAAGRLNELKNTALDESVRYTYDQAGDRSGLLLPWGKVDYRYDVQGNLIGLNLPEGGSIEIDVDAEGHRKQIRYPNGVTTTFTRTRGRLVRTVSEKDGRVIDSIRYGYDDQGHVAWREDAAGLRTSYAYDARGNLLEAKNSEETIRYAYDAAGNRVSETRTEAGSEAIVRFEVGAGNRVMSRSEGEASTAYSYSEAGVLTGAQDADGTTRYLYDHDDKLVRVEKPDGSVVTYGYAPNGTRLWRQDQQERTNYLHDLADVVGELDGDGKLLTSYVHGTGLDDVLSARRGDESFFYHYDLVRSVSAMTGAEGRVAARYEYDPFGGQTRAEGDAAAWNPFRFTSRNFDGATGLYHYRARTYAPVLGRFTSADPTGLLGGLNLYAYAGNDPLMFNDPFGLWPKWLDRASSWVSDKVNAGANWVDNRLSDARDWVVGVADDLSETRFGKSAIGGALVYGARQVSVFGIGFVKGTVNAGKGIANMVLHPVETVKGIYNAVKNWDETKEALGALWDEYKDAAMNDPVKFAEMTGKLTAEIIVSVAGTKGLDKLAKARTLGKLGQAGRVAASPVTRTAARTGGAVASRFPRVARVVRNGRVASRARNIELARRAAAGGNLFSRAGRRVVNFGRDIASGARMAVRSPGAFMVYSGSRMSAAAAGLVASTGRGIWTATKYAGIPTLMVFQDNITDAIDRYKTREEAVGAVRDAGQSLLDDASDLSPEELAQRLEQVGEVYRGYRNRLMKPIHDEDQRLDAELTELDRKVEAGEIPDNTIDSRLAAMLEEYGRRRHNHMVELYDRNREEEHDMLNPSMNRTISFQDEIDLLEAVKSRTSDPTSQALLEARQKDLQELMAYEYNLFKAGNHDELIAGISGPPRDPTGSIPELSAGDELEGIDMNNTGFTDTMEDLWGVEEVR